MIMFFPRWNKYYSSQKYDSFLVIYFNVDQMNTVNLDNQKRHCYMIYLVNLFCKFGVKFSYHLLLQVWKKIDFI